MSFYKAILFLTGIVSSANAWSHVTISRSSVISGYRGKSNLFLKQEKSEGSHTQYAADSNPCWQDFYDDDCSMSAIYAASFVAKDWIKSMPCASGLEVSLTKIETNYQLDNLINTSFSTL